MSNRVDPLRAEVERLAKEWEQDAADLREARDRYRGNLPAKAYTAAADAADIHADALRTALAAAAPPPEPPGWEEIERLVDAYGEAAATFCPEMDERCMKRNAAAQKEARSRLLSALREAVKGGGK